MTATIEAWSKNRSPTALVSATRALRCTHRRWSTVDEAGQGLQQQLDWASNHLYTGLASLLQ